MKKLIAFGDTITFPSKDGISAHTIGNLLALVGADFKITLVTCSRDDSRLSSMPFDVLQLSVEEYYNPSVVAALLDTLNPDILQTYSSYYARLILFDYASEKHIPTIVEHHDVDTEHMAAYGKKGIDRWQREALERASLSRTLSSADATKLQRLLPEMAGKIHNIPTILMTDVDQNTAVALEAGDGVLFVGNCSYPPNKSAVELIIGSLASRMPETTFYIAGRNSDLLKNDHANVKLLGFVDDVADIARKCRIGIAPLSYGSGLKLKVLTYLSLGLPVIGTSIAFAGFDNRRHMHESEIKDFVRVLSDMLKKHEYVDKASVIRHYEETYGSASVIQKLRQLYSNIIFNETLTIENTGYVPADVQYVPVLNEIR